VPMIDYGSMASTPTSVRGVGKDFFCSSTGYLPLSEEIILLMTLRYALLRSRHRRRHSYRRQR
jgi:hypothetical protein